MQRLTEITYLNRTYPITLKRKMIKRITMRPSADGLLVHAPIGVPHIFIKATIIKHMPKLVNALNKEAPMSQQHLYFFGQRYVSNDDYLKVYFTCPIDNFENPIFLKQLRVLALRYFIARTRHYETIMGIQRPYTVKVREMKTRLGSNAKTSHSLTFARHLIHYSVAIIDAVIVHELAHYFAFDHSKQFYDVLLKYYPNYKIEHQKIRQGNYQ